MNRRRQLYGKNDYYLTLKISELSRRDSSLVWMHNSCSGYSHRYGHH